MQLIEQESTEPLTLNPEIDTSSPIPVIIDYTNMFPEIFQRRKEIHD